MQLPRPRGPFSEQVFAAMVVADPTPVPYDAGTDVLSDEDVQIALWALYELSYRGFDDVDPAHEATEEQYREFLVHRSVHHGAYVEVVPAPTHAVNNAMSLFALHRRLRGALMGHLAAFESTSSLPSRRYAGGSGRLGFDERVTASFDEHVEADAVHEQLACRSICQRLVEQHPELHRDVLMGATACVQMEARAGAHLIDAWRAGSSALLDTVQQEVA